jgi:hypothetical protein
MSYHVPWEAKEMGRIDTCSIDIATMKKRHRMAQTAGKPLEVPMTRAKIIPVEEPDDGNPSCPVL